MRLRVHGDRLVESPEVDPSLVDRVLRVKGYEFVLLAYLTRYVKGNPSGAVGNVRLPAKYHHIGFGHGAPDHARGTHTGRNGTHHDYTLHRTPPVCSATRATVIQQTISYDDPSTP